MDEIKHILHASHMFSCASPVLYYVRSTLLHSLTCCRVGVQLGSVTEHIELAGCAGDCRSFLLLLLGGAISPSMSQIAYREEGVHRLCGAVSKSLSKISTLHPQCATVLSRGSRMSVFATAMVGSKARNSPQQGPLPYQNSDVKADGRRVGALVEGDAEVKSCSREGATLEGSTLDTSSCRVDLHAIAPSERDPGPSMELSVSIIKELTSLILDVKSDMDAEQAVLKSARGCGLESGGGGDRQGMQFCSSSTYRAVATGRTPSAGTGTGTMGRLQDRFIIQLEGCPLGDIARMAELNDRTTVRILRAIMAKGTAATVLETVKILTSTFGHGSGNILLPLAPQQVRRTDEHTHTRSHRPSHVHRHVGALSRLGTHRAQLPEHRHLLSLIFIT